MRQAARSDFEGSACAFRSRASACEIPRNITQHVKDGGVSLVDAATLRRIGFLATGDGAHGLAVSRDTKNLYVTNRLAGTISVINFASRKVIATWRVGGSPDMIQVSPDGNQVWVSNRFGASVSVISTRTGKVLHVIPVGSSPHGLALFPQPGRASSATTGCTGDYRAARDYRAAGVRPRSCATRLPSSGSTWLQ
jgi:YVTN family beta-propeller protein